MVIWLSLAMERSPFFLRSRLDRGGGSCCLRLLGQEQDLVPDHLVGDLQRTVELLLGFGLRLEPHDDVVPLRLPGELIGEALASPAVELGHLTTGGADDLADAIDRRRHQGLVGLGWQDEHALVLPQRSPPLVWTAPREGEQVGMRAVHECTGTARPGIGRRALPARRCVSGYAAERSALRYR